jgi:hypothetical protein
MHVKICAAVALCLATGIAAAQTATPAAAAQAPAAQAVANPVAPGAIQALKDMGAYLQTLKRFQVTTEVTGERVLADGQKLQHGARAVLDVARPNQLRAVMSTGRSERELFYNGSVATLYTASQKSYSSVEMSGNLAEFVERLRQRYGIEVPLSDLFLWGTPAAPFDKIESAMNAGQDYVDGVLCDHYAFRQGKLDWQLWIAVGAQPLPCKLVITNRADEARPQSVSRIQWNLKPAFKDSVFTFVPPKGVTKAQIVPLKKP